MAKNKTDIDTIPSVGQIYTDENGDRVAVIALDSYGVKYAPEGSSTEQLVSFGEFNQRFRAADLVPDDAVSDQEGDGENPDSTKIESTEGDD